MFVCKRSQLSSTNAKDYDLETLTKELLAMKVNFLVTERDEVLTF